MKTINKETICDQAVELFLSQGYNNVTVNDICTALNITKPTFYKYVSSKEELILDLYDRTISGLLNDPLHFIEANTHLEQLYLIFATLMCVWQVGIQPARQRKSNHFGSEIQPPYCSAIALSNVANGNSAHHA